MPSINSASITPGTGAVSFGSPTTTAGNTSTTAPTTSSASATAFRSPKGSGTTGVRLTGLTTDRAGRNTTSYTFDVAFTESDPALGTAAITNAPLHWNVSVTAADTITVIHNVGSQPSNAMVWASTATAGEYVNVGLDGAAYTANGFMHAYLSYTTATIGTTTTINGFNASSTNSVPGGTATVVLIF